MFTKEYLEIKDNLLHNITLEEFDNWKFIDCYGLKTSEVQFPDDLRRELEKVERYDLLINLRDATRENSLWHLRRSF